MDKFEDMFSTPLSMGRRTVVEPEIANSFKITSGQQIRIVFIFTLTSPEIKKNKTMKRVFTLLLILLVFTGCSSNDINCETGPVGFDFEIVDEATGENLFLNGLDEDNQLYIENSVGEVVEYLFDTERNVFGVSLGWESKSDTYSVIIDGEVEFDIVFSLQRSSSGGCSSTQLRELDIVGASYETSNTTGVTTIFVGSEGI